ncbi:MAG: hypothetical protein GY851_20000, partial [bacterium]|nr:hypothetical protein [bacterium]
MPTLPDGTTMALAQTNPSVDPTSIWEMGWTVPANVEQGYPVAVFGARDEAKLWNEEQVPFMVNLIPPDPPLIVPTPPRYVNTSTIGVSGRTDGAWRAVTLHVLHDGTETTYLAETQTMPYWDIPVVTLGEGQNVLWATSRDLFGNVSASSAQVVVTVDTSPPQVTAWAIPAILRSGTTLTPTAEVDDNQSIAGVWAEVIHPNGGELALSYHAGDDLWRQSYVIDSPGLAGEGEKSFQVRASDVAGNTSVETVTVTVDNTAPTGAVRINGGDEFSAQHEVLLTLVATDTYTVSDVLLSDDCCPTQGWQPYAPGDVAWTLAGGEGERQVWARYRDAAGNESAWYSNAITVDTLPPSASIYDIVEDSPYVYVDGVVYYGAQAGSFEVQVAAYDNGSGLAQAEFPAATSAGGVYDTALAGDHQYAHTYAFTAASTEEGAYQVVVRDQMGYEAEANFTLVRDAAPPQVRVDATVQGGIVTVSWGASDGGSGLNTCTLEVREGDGEWQTFSTDCAGTDTYDSASPGEVCTFRLVASDNTGNQASAEETTGVSRVTKYYYA